MTLRELGLAQVHRLDARFMAAPRPAIGPIRPGAMPPPLPTLRQPAVERVAVPRRSRIWDFDASLHCSIVGTCLSTAELRQVLRKLGLASDESTDHELHGVAVGLAARSDTAAKLLNKSLDRRHATAINQFAKAATEADLALRWRDAVKRGEIPGAYWATLTHPAATRAVIREAFGDVHMLSHLVGAANRADIRRLRELEALNAELTARLERQQVAFRDAVTQRDRTIGELGGALATRVSEDAGDEGDASGDAVALRALATELDRRLETETRRRIAVEERLEAMRAARARDHAALATAGRENDQLRAELDLVERMLAREDDEVGQAPPQLDGRALLYVGGHAQQIAHLRGVGEQFGAQFLHHDGGREQSADVLASLVSRADLVLFPVECVSHEAARAVKRLCRQTGKPFIPLRSASVTSFVAALGSIGGISPPR